MSYLFGDVATWLIGKKYNSEDEVAKGVDISGDKEKSEVVIDHKEIKGEKEPENEEDKNEEEGNTNKGSLENDLEEVSTLAYHKAKDIGNYIFNLGKTYGKQVAQTAQTIKGAIEENTMLGEFSKEQEKFVSNNKVKKSASDTSVPPWVGYNEEEAMKKQILDLSKDKRNLLRDPPSGIQFNFDFESSHPQALTMLQLDPTLNSLRFQLVPKQIKEENFWRNYFYRVSLIKQSTQLHSIASNTDMNKSDSKRSSSSQLNEDIDEDAEHKADDDSEFVSDSFNNTQLVEDADLNDAMQQLNTGHKDEEVTNEEVDKIEGEEEVDWEAELREELHEYEVVSDAAIENDILQQLN